jgi:cytochrome c5
MIVKNTILFFLLLSISVLCIASDETETRRLYEDVCAQCHSLSAIELTRNGRAGWEDTVHKMVVVGAQLSLEEMEVIIDYLYRHYGPDSSNPMRTGVLPHDSALQEDGIVSSENIVLPEGEGKQLLEGYCMLCHDLGRIVATARGEDEWQAYVQDMLRRNEMSINEEQLATMLSYLNKNFGDTDAH